MSQNEIADRLGVRSGVETTHKEIRMKTRRVVAVIVALFLEKSCCPRQKLLSRSSTCLLLADN